MKATITLPNRTLAVPKLKSGRPDDITQYNRDMEDLIRAIVDNFTKQSIAVDAYTKAETYARTEIYTKAEADAKFALLP